MAQPHAFDPLHALDGWRPPASAPVDLKLQPLAPQGVPWPVDTAVGDAFDPTQALDGWRPPAPAPLDLELGSLLRFAGSGPDPAKRARLKARGYEMRDVEDIDLPDPPPARSRLEAGPLLLGHATPAQGLPGAETAELPPQTGGPPAPEADLWQPPVAPAPAPAPAAAEAPVLDFRAEPPRSGPVLQQVLAGIELPSVAPLPADAEPPQLDTPVATLPAADPRLVTDWQPGAWTAIARRIRGAAAEIVQTSTGPRVEDRPAQWLCALWPPHPGAAPVLPRWPEMAVLVDAETAFGALHQLLPELPPEARLWPAELDVDWALVADLVVRHDARLSTGQAQALRELVEAERGASLARIDGGYQQRDGAARRRA